MINQRQNVRSTKETKFEIPPHVKKEAETYEITTEKV